MIRAAKISDIDTILSVTNACASHMIAMGIHQWNDLYPSRAAFERDLERNELFVLEDQERLIGGIVVSTFMDCEYKDIEWLTPSDNNIYVHRLFVHPDWQGKGHARQLMDFAEQQARSKGFDAVRLDTFSQNKRNQKFYEARGYQRLGNIFFPRQSTHPFYCYELPL